MQPRHEFIDKLASGADPIEDSRGIIINHPRASATVLNAVTALKCLTEIFGFDYPQILPMPL